MNSHRARCFSLPLAHRIRGGIGALVLLMQRIQWQLAQRRQIGWRTRRRAGQPVDPDHAGQYQQDDDQRPFWKAPRQLGGT